MLDSVFVCVDYVYNLTGFSGLLSRDTQYLVDFFQLKFACLAEGLVVSFASEACSSVATVLTVAAVARPTAFVGSILDFCVELCKSRIVMEIVLHIFLYSVGRLTATQYS